MLDLKCWLMAQLNAEGDISKNPQSLDRPTSNENVLEQK